MRQTPTGSPAAPVGGEAPIRVLIVEDHPAFSKAIRALLEGEDGIIVLGDVRTGFEGISHPLLDDADAVLIDVGLPDMSGIDATEQLLLRNPALCVVVMSGSGYDQTPRDALACGAAAYLQKGCLQDELVQTILSAARA